MLDDNTLLIGLISVVCLIVGTIVFLNKKPPTVLPQTDFKDYPLIKKEILSRDTRKFTFGLSEGHILGLPTGQHVSLRFKDSNGKTHMRSYTPVTDNSSVGNFSLVIKVYKANVHPKFPEGGKMSQHLDSLKIGETIEMKGPKGHMEYLMGGSFTVKPLGKPKESRQTNQIIMIAGGTGITPMLQILHFIFENPGDTSVKVNLLYANQSAYSTKLAGALLVIRSSYFSSHNYSVSSLTAEDDILVRSELEGLLSKFPDRFGLHYTVDSPPAGWKYSTGFISKEMLEKHCLFNNSSKNTQVFMCGPPPMIKYACEPNLKELGFSNKEMVVF